MCHFVRKASLLDFSPLAILPLIVSLILLTSCDPGKIKLSDYYFPVKDLKEGKVYIYKSINDSIPPSLWYYHGINKGSDLLLESQSFDLTGNINQHAFEKKVNSGMLLQSNTIYLPDSLGQMKKISVEILQKNMFPFSVTDTNGLFIYNVKWSVKPGTHNEVTRNRRFLGFEEHDYKGKPVKCAKFELKELIEDYNEGYLEYKLNGFEYYGKNIGLIYYEKVVNNNLRIAYQLQDILTVKAFEEQYKTTFKPITE